MTIMFYNDNIFKFKFKLSVMATDSRDLLKEF